MTKQIAKKAATPKPAVTKKAAIAKKDKKVKTPQAPQPVCTTVEVNTILERMNSKIKLTDDAVQLLNAYITSLFTNIAK